MKALFPSIRDIEAARMVREAVEESEMNLENVNWKQALRYLTIVGGCDYMREIGLGKYMPVWRGERSDLITVGGEKSQKEESWRDSRHRIPNAVKKKIAARVLETAVIVCMGTHVYTFCDKLYLQQSGGPIGMRFTASLASLIMKKCTGFLWAHVLV